MKRDLGTTLVVVTHNIPSARTLADDLVFLEEGRVIERGTPDALEHSDNPTVHRFMASVGATG